MAEKTTTRKKKQTVRVVDFPARVSTIANATAPKHWQDLWGTTVKLANGDSFGIWSQDKYEVELFVEGATIVYELSKVITNPGTDKERVKFRARYYDFIRPRAERYEIYVPEMLARSVAKSASIAAQLIIADTELQTTDFNKVADMVNDWMRGKFVGMQFSLEENLIDTQKILADVKEKATDSETPDSGGGPDGQDDSGDGDKKRRKLGGSKAAVPEA